MLSAIREIGELTKDKPNEARIGMDASVVVILIEASSQKYLGVDIEDFDSKKIEKYLFKPGASKGNVPWPFCPLTESNRSFKKIYRWLGKCKKNIENRKNDGSRDYIELLAKACKILEDNKDLTITNIIQKTNEFSKKNPKFLTIKIDGKYLGEYDVFRKCLACFDEGKRRRSANQGICSICGNFDNEVSGKTDVFKFYTIDKPGFITGGFKEINAWKNYPVCSKCETLLESGKAYIENNLNFKFYGFSYLLIPRLLIGGKEKGKEILNILSTTKKGIGLGERVIKRITDDENEILENISMRQDILTLNFLFLQRKQSAERILLLIEDIFPSRIRRIFDAKDYVDKIFDNEPERAFTFGTLRTFFSKSDDSKRTSDLDKYFLNIVGSVFIGEKIDFSFLLVFFMAVIRKEFINDRYFKFRTKDALMIMIFLEHLEIMSFIEEVYMEDNIFSSIFSRYGKSFGNPAKRGVFLTGALTQLLLNKQWADRKAKPFMKKLKGLKLEEKDVKALLPEVQNKLEEYDSFDSGKKLLSCEAAKYLLEAGDGWKMSVNEINFYFACGMNLADEVAKKIYSKENNKKEE